MVGFRTCMVNGTAVLGLASFDYDHLYFTRDSLDTSARCFVAWKIALGRRSSVVERGSHNP
jgi:hypothetical protein